MSSKVEFEITANGLGKLLIDGQDRSSELRGFDLAVRAGKPTVLTLVCNLPSVIGSAECAVDTLLDAQPVKEVARIEENGVTRRLLAIELTDPVEESSMEYLRAALNPIGQRYGVDFMLLGPGMRLVDPAAVPAREA